MLSVNMTIKHSWNRKTWSLVLFVVFFSVSVFRKRSRKVKGASGPGGGRGHGDGGWGEQNGKRKQWQGGVSGFSGFLNSSALSLQPQRSLIIVWVCCNGDSLQDQMAENEWMNESNCNSHVHEEGNERRRDDRGGKSSSEGQACRHQPHPWDSMVWTPQDGAQTRHTPQEQVYSVLCLVLSSHLCVSFRQVCGVDGRRSRVLLQPDNTAVHVGPARGAGWPSWCWQTHPGASTQERTGGHQEDRCGLTRVVSRVSFNLKSQTNATKGETGKQLLLWLLYPVSYTAYWRMCVHSCQGGARIGHFYWRESGWRANQSEKAEVSRVCPSLLSAAEL